VLAELDVGDPPLADEAADETLPGAQYSAAWPMVSSWPESPRGMGPWADAGDITFLGAVARATVSGRLP